MINVLAAHLKISLAGGLYLPRRCDDFVVVRASYEQRGRRYIERERHRRSARSQACAALRRCLSSPIYCFRCMEQAGCHRKQCSHYCRSSTGGSRRLPDTSIGCIARCLVFAHRGSVGSILWQDMGRRIHPNYYSTAVPMLVRLQPVLRYNFRDCCFYIVNYITVITFRSQFDEDYVLAMGHCMTAMLIRGESENVMIYEVRHQDSFASKPTFRHAGCYAPVQEDEIFRQCRSWGASKVLLGSEDAHHCVKLFLEAHCFDIAFLILVLLPVDEFLKTEVLWHVRVDSRTGPIRYCQLSSAVAEISVR